MKQFLHLLLGLLASCPVLAQKPVVSLSADLKQVQPGENIVLTVKSNVSGDLNLDVPDEFIYGGGTVQGMNTEMDYNTGKTITYQYFSKNGVFSEAGTYKIQAFINSGKHVYKSNVLTIRVEKKVQCEEEISERTFQQPVFGMIQRSKKRIYEGEPLVLESKVFSRIRNINLASYGTYEVDGKSEFYELGEPERYVRSKESYKGQTFLSLTNGKRLYFISSPGKYRIKPFEMLLEYERNGFVPEQLLLTSTASSIEVLPLPDRAPADFAGLVGQYQLQCSISKKSAKKGDVIQLTMVVSGKGNLHNIAEPRLNLPKGITLYSDPEKKEEIEFGAYGAEGKITFTFHLHLQQGGKQRIPEITLSYFNPEQKSYVQLRKHGFTIEVDGPISSGVVQYADVPQNPSSEEHPAIMTAAQPESNWLVQKWYWPVAVSPLLLGLLAGMFWVRRKDLTEVLTERQQKRTVLQELNKRIQALKTQPANAQTYAELEQIMRSMAWLFVNRQEHIPSREETLAILEQQQVAPALVTRLRELFSSCEEARFAFYQQENKLHEWATEVESILQQIG